MIVAFRSGQFEQNINEDERNGRRLTKFVPYCVERIAKAQTDPTLPPLPPLSPRSASKFVMLVSFNTSVIDDFDCDDYFPLDTATMKNICSNDYSCSRVLDYIGGFVGEKEYAYLYLEDLGDCGIEFSNWVGSLMATTRSSFDQWVVSGRSEPECFQASREFANFCDALSRMSVSHTKSKPAQTNAKMSYLDAVKKPAAVIAPPAVEEPILVVKEQRQWHPQLVIDKTKRQKLDKKYGSQPEDNMPMMTDEEYSDLIDAALVVKYKTGVTRVRAITRLPPQIIAKKNARMVAKYGAPSG